MSPPAFDDFEDDKLIQTVRARLPDAAPAPASKAEVAEAERQLGFPLHPLLRRLYLEVANGGWGPEYGAPGLITGARPDQPAQGLVAWYLAMRLPPEDGDDWPGWPETLVPITHWGCAIWSCVDCSMGEGRVVRFDPNTHGWSDKEPWKVAWLPERPSLSAWLRDWLDGRLSFEMPVSAVQ